MNWRAIGCGLAAAIVFVGLGLFAMSLAFERSAGCTPLLLWQGIAYRSSGPPTETARLPSGAAPEVVGIATVGLTTRTVYGPPGTAQSPVPAPSESATPVEPPAELAVDCADGTFQAYQRDGSP